MSTETEIKKFDYSSTDMVIYHGGCPDGLGGAWCFIMANKSLFPTKENSPFFPGKYGSPPPDVKDKHIVLVDFSYPVNDILEMLKTAKSIRVLDHHKTALPLKDISHPNFSYVIDMNRSGAEIAYDEIHGMSDKARPWFTNDIGDRDRWAWNIPDSKHTTRAMNGLGYYESLELFSLIGLLPREYYIKIGKAFTTSDEKLFQSVAQKASYATSIINDKVYKVRLVNSQHTSASDVGALLCQDGTAHFAVVYRHKFDTND